MPEDHQLQLRSVPRKHQRHPRFRLLAKQQFTEACLCYQDPRNKKDATSGYNGVSSAPVYSKIDANRKGERGEREKGLGFRYGGSLVMWTVVIFAILMIEAMVMRVSGGAKMSTEVVRKVGEELDVKADFKGRLRFLEEKLGHVSVEKINNCSSEYKNWVLDKDGPLLHIRCILYKNMVEKLSIWGFPVQTSGLLTTGLSPKSFTVISGKINEWSGSKLWFNGRRRSESWISSKRNATAVQLTGNTWILEYNQSPLLQDSRLIPLIKEFLTSRASRVMNEILQLDWLLQTSSYRSYVVKSSNYEDERSSLPPT